jgi:hypothetical protein
MKGQACAGLASLGVLAVAASCASMSGGAYRAASLRVFVPVHAARVEEHGVTLLAGRLRDQSEVMRVLGRRSARLARDAAVLQVSVTTATEPVRLQEGSFRLVVAGGEVCGPLTSGQVLAAVSLPEEYWSTPYHAVDIRGPLAQAPGSPPTQRIEGISALFMLTMVALDAAIFDAGASQYRDQARADVEGKTSLPREVAPGKTLDMLLVFVPQSRPGAEEGALPLHVSLDIGGTRLEKTLVVE